MKYSNFKLSETTGTCPSNIMYVLEFDKVVTTGALWWKKTEVTKLQANFNITELLDLYTSPRRSTIVEQALRR